MLPANTRTPVVERIASFSTRHRVAVVLGWLALVVLAQLLGAFAPGTDAHARDPGESGTAQGILAQQDAYEPISESVLISGSDPKVIEDLVGTLTKTGAVEDILTPSDDPARAKANSALVSFRIAGGENEIRPNFAAATAAVDAVAARHPGALAQAGDRSVTTAVDQSIREDIKRSETRSLPITLLILVLVFGSLIAASLPLLLGATTVIAAFGFLGALDNVVAVNSATSAMTVLIGMAVGVDYSLFFLRRVREERADGHSVDDAIRTAARTSGHVVAVSGLTVVLCLCGLLFTGLDNFIGLTAAIVLVVGLAVLAALTVLPATVSLLGPWVDRLRVRRRDTPGRSRLWGAVADRVTGRPALWGGLAAVLLVLLTMPAFGMRLQAPSPTESLPRSIPAIDAAARMQEEFPGIVAPARVVVWAEDGGPVDSPRVRQAIGELAARIPGPVVTAQVDRALVVRVPLAGTGNDEAANRSLAELRKTVVPQTIGKIDGVGYAVAGRTAVSHDFAGRVNDRAVLVFVFILTLAFVLLLIAFRSLAVPLLSILLNLLSVGAAYGVLTLVFQDGFLAPLLGFTPYGGILDWLPLFLFVVLFGLSMDYHIFILSRIRERRLRGASPRDAIVGGTATSSGVVTGAALIMTGVFGVFVSLAAVEYKMLGLGMAVAILLDATVVRGVLLPAALALLGRRLWPANDAEMLKDPSRTLHLS